MLSYPDKQPWPVPPTIRRLGTLMCDIVETTPIVFGGELYRFEYVRAGEGMSRTRPNEEPRFHFVHVRTDHAHAPFAFNHHLGSAFTDGGVLYAVGLRDRWHSDTLDFYRGADPDHMEQYASLTLEGYQLFNTGVCKKDGKYILLMETIDPTLPHAVPFTFRFAESDDMTNWTLLPNDRVFQPDRYAGGPAIYTLPGDPYYYVFYLEAYPCERYATSLARSLDLKTWEYSPINPVLMYDAAQDKQIASPFLKPAERERIAAALDVNNSDLELCEYLGRTVLYYSWGNQHGNEFLAEAWYEGSMADFLHSYFA